MRLNRIVNMLVQRTVVFFVLASCLVFVEAQRPGFGKCPGYATVKDFDIKKVSNQ